VNRLAANSNVAEKVRLWERRGAEQSRTHPPYAGWCASLGCRRCASIPEFGSRGPRRGTSSRPYSDAQSCRSSARTMSVSAILTHWLGSFDRPTPPATARWSRWRRRPPHRRSGRRRPQQSVAALAGYQGRSSDFIVPHRRPKVLTSASTDGSPLPAPPIRSSGGACSDCSPARRPSFPAAFGWPATLRAPRAA
jgi:hypothetical protein